MIRLARHEEVIANDASARRRWRSVALILFMGLVFSSPALIFGLPDSSDDGVYHAIWYKHFSAQLWAGDIYPRWLQGMNAGLGSPVFYYYPPAPYFLTSLLRPVLSSVDPLGWYQLGIAASVALMLSGISCYLWLFEIVNDDKAACVAAILYVWMPYHLAIDFYARGAFAELCAFVWMPLILYAVVRLIKGGRFAFVGLSAAYAGLCLTHLPVTLMFSLVPLAYAYSRAARGRKMSVTFQTLAAMLLGATLAAFYLLPAFLTQADVSLTDMRGGYFYYAEWFLLAKPEFLSTIRAVIFWFTLSTVGVAMCAFLLTRSLRRDIDSNDLNRTENLFWAAVAVLSLLMMTHLSDFVWKLITPLQAIQFPWRFNAVFAIAASALIAIAIEAWRAFPSSAQTSIKNARRGATMRATLIVTVLILITWIPATAWAMWTGYTKTFPVQSELHRISETTAHSRDAREYRPRTVPSLEERDFGEVLRRIGDEDAARVRIERGAANVEVRTWQPRLIELHVDAAEDAALLLRRFHYARWSVYVARVGEMKNAVSSPVALNPSQPDGLMSLEIPRGSYNVTVRLEKSQPERVGQIVSASAALVFLLFLLRAFQLRNKFSSSEFS